MVNILQLFKDTPAPPEITANGSQGMTPIYDASLEVEANNSPYSMMYSGAGTAPAVHTWETGDKFPGGFGVTELLTMDYWTLRARSGQLFRQNLYARGIIRRMVTNEINTGLTLECLPEESILGLQQDSLVDWTDDVEKRYSIYSRSMADYTNNDSMGQIERTIRRESLIDGDILVVLRQETKTGVPQVQLIRGDRIRTPLDLLNSDTRVIEGVEVDDSGKHLAYWYRKDDLTFERLPAFGKRSGRRLAWLVYGTERRHGEVRGEPMLAILLQSLKDLDRYRDAALRKSVINSLLAMFVSKENDKMGTMPMTGASTLNRTVTPNTGEPAARSFNISDYGAPGIILDELQQGETPHAFKTETDVDYGKFEESMVQAMAWALEIPPEILRLTFSSNYSASQASINEYKLYLNPTRAYQAQQVNQPIYEAWFLNEVLNNRITAQGFVDAWRKKDLYTTGAWVSTDWSGAIKPSVDLVKMAKAYEIMVDRAWISNDRVARELSGTKFGRNVSRNRNDNVLLAEMRRPIAEFQQEFKEDTESEAAGIDGFDNTSG